MEKTISTFSDPQVLMFEIRKRKKDVIFWATGIIFALLIFFFISSKDYSFFLVLSSLVQALAFIIIFIKVFNYQSSGGLSISTLICYAILFASRLTSTLFFNGYLPSDDAGDWFYQLTEIVSLLTVLLLIYLTKTAFQDTSDLRLDTFPFYYLVLPCFVLALFIHSDLNHFIVTDFLWAFSMYLEAVAIFPQIRLFALKQSQIETYTSHYVALCGISRLLSLLFWWDTYPELNTSSEDSFLFFNSYCGYFIILAQLSQIVIMADFYYLYFKSLLKGESMNTINL